MLVLCAGCTTAEGVQYKIDHAHRCDANIARDQLHVSKYINGLFG